MFELAKYFSSNNSSQTISYFVDIFFMFNGVNLVLQGKDTNIISLSNQIKWLKNKTTFGLTMLA